MKIKNGKIVSARENEMYKYWLAHELDDLYSFTEYIRLCEENGIIITEKESEEQSNAN